jgi:hypothetical protein
MSNQVKIAPPSPSEMISGYCYDDPAVQMGTPDMDHITVPPGSTR